MTVKSKINKNKKASDAQGISEKTFKKSFYLGMAIIAVSFVLGHSYTFIATFLIFSLFMTILWRKKQKPWLLLASTAAATPVVISRFDFSTNTIFAIWFVILKPRQLLKLPIWIYIPILLIVVGLLTSAIHWMAGDMLRSMSRELVYMFNNVLAPFLFLPAIYILMRENPDRTRNLQGLLFCLIVPATLILIVTKLFGSVVNEWEASLHAGSLSEGFLIYKLGRVYVSYLRTEVGFILAALICASAAVTVSHVRRLYRIVTAVCLASNLFLLLSTGSFGSAFACLCGLTVIFYMQSRVVNMTKIFASLAVILCIIVLTYAIMPQSVKGYLGKRYEHRVTNANTDRFDLWANGTKYLLKYPLGVGFTLRAGETEKEKAYTHNDYLSYAISYGFIGGIGYIIFVCGLFVSFFRMRRKIPRDAAAMAVYLAGFGVFVAVAVNCFTDHMSSCKWFFNVMWSIIWYCYFCSRIPPAAEQVQNDPLLKGMKV